MFETRTDILDRRSISVKAYEKEKFGSTENKINEYEVYIIKKQKTRRTK